jgi:predicted RNA-binding protein with PUA-like domain
MKYWLMKSEPDVFSITDLKAKKSKGEHWDGVRNYQARNFMRDEMKVGDRVLFYHSNCDVPGIVGIAEVNKEAVPDHTAFDKKSKYFDPKSDPENPRWMMVYVKYVKEFKETLSLKEIKDHKTLSEMKVAQKGQRLSIQPVEKKHFELCEKLGS